MNAVMLSGTVVRDVALRYTPRAVAMAHLYLAGKTHGRAWYHRVTVFGKRAEDLADTPVATILTVAAHLEHRTWTTEGGDRRSALNIVADHVARRGFAMHAEADAKGQPVLRDAWNRAMVAGNLTRDARARSVASGRLVCDAALAIHEGQGDDERTHFVDVTGWGTAAEDLQDGRKGDRIIASGRLVVDSWEGRDGTMRYRTKVDVDHVTTEARGPRRGGGAGSTPTSDAGSREKGAYAHDRGNDDDGRIPPEEPLPFSPF